MCASGLISNYCEAILTAGELCGPGIKCCVSSNIVDDKNVTNTITTNKTKTNATKKDVKTTIKTTVKPHTAPTENYLKTTPLTTHPKNKCKGECINGFLALLCDDIDANADCPAENSCCITIPVSLAFINFATQIILNFNARFLQIGLNTKINPCFPQKNVDIENAVFAYKTNILE